MRKLFILLFVCSFNAATSQVDPLAEVKKPKQFIAIIQTINHRYDKGVIKDMNDSMLTIQAMAVSEESKRPMHDYAIENINAITIRNRKAINKGAWIGAGVGLLLGVIAGISSNDDYVSEYPLSVAFAALSDGRFENTSDITLDKKSLALGAGGGALVGAFIGSLAKKKFIINGNRKRFEAMKLSVLERTYGK